MSELTAADIAAINSNGNNAGIFGGNGVTLIVLILFFLTLGNGGLFGGNNSSVQGALTRAELTDGLNNQNVVTDLGNIQSAITNSTANITLSQNNGFNSINSNIAALQSAMQQNCCDIKTAMHAEGEATRALIQNNTIQDLRDQIASKDRELLTTGLTAAQVVQTNNLETYMRQLINGTCGCGA